MIDLSNMEHIFRICINASGVIAVVVFTIVFLCRIFYNGFMYVKYEEMEYSIGEIILDSLAGSVNVLILLIFLSGIVAVLQWVTLIIVLSLLTFWVGCYLTLKVIHLRKNAHKDSI